MDHQDFNPMSSSDPIADLETLAPDQEETEPLAQEEMGMPSQQPSSDTAEWDELMELLFKDEEQLPTNNEGISGASLVLPTEPQLPDFNRKRKGKEVEEEDCQNTENVVYKDTCMGNKYGGAITFKEQNNMEKEVGGSTSQQQKREAHNLRDRQRREEHNKILKELKELIQCHDRVTIAQLVAKIIEHIILLQEATETVSLINATMFVILHYYHQVNVVGSEDENREMSIIAEIFTKLINGLIRSQDPSGSNPPNNNIPDDPN